MLQSIQLFSVRLWWKRWLAVVALVLHRAALSSYKNNCLGVAKGAAYSALLSFFPVLTTLTAILVQANAVSVSKAISNFVFEVVPPGTEEIVLYNFTERGQRPITLLIIATILALWAASGVMISLMQGFQAAYGTPNRRSFLKTRWMAVVLVFSAALPIVAASALIVFGGRTEAFVFTRLGVITEGTQILGWLPLVGQIVRYAVSLLAIVVGASLLYYFGPDTKHRWRQVWPGALLATALWWIATTAFGWYVRHIANYNVLYGSVGAVVAMLVWMYLLSIIALFGCEYNAQLLKLQGDRSTA
jgi:membrane protein